MTIKYPLFPILLALSFCLFPENGQIVKREAFNLLDDQKIFNRVTKDNELLNEFQYLNEVRTEKITYMSDGLKVTAYLVYPVIERKHPCIIYNRGGNREFGSITKTKLAFMLAKISHHGYIVIGSQYRGNDGGEGREEFGGKDVKDVLNLIPLLKKLENADGSKIGIFGWSRGGMMTYLALTKNSEFKAAVVGGGIADLSMMKNNRPDMEKFVYSELMPDYDESKDSLLFERSAVNHVKKFPKETPILLLHGTADWRVKPVQSIRLAELFLKERIPFRLVLFEGGDHGLTEFSYEVDNMIINWFDKYLKREERFPSLVPHGR
jgi:dipeptidyl aminopeptidase/acylaminoacyl peptidase